MPPIPVAVRDFCHADDGATAFEYGLMLALVAAVVVVGARSLGTQAASAFETTGQVLVSAS